MSRTRAYCHCPATARQGCDQLRAEHAAFEAFADRIKALEVRQPAAVTSPSSTPSLIDSTSNASTGAVRRAYCETVLALDHYEEIYDEPLLVNIRGELGPDVAAQLSDEGSVSPPLIYALLLAVQRLCAERSTLLDHLDDEASSLKEVHSVLADAIISLNEQEEPGGGDNDDLPIDKLSRQCEAIAEPRQSLIQSRHISSSLDGHDLCTYLYESDGGN